MELLCGPRWHGTTNGGEGDWDSGRPQKRLRNSKSHASFLQPVTKLVRSPLDTLGSLAEGLGYGLLGNMLSGHEQERQLELLRLHGATTCEEWQAAAEQLDEIEGGNEWKDRDESDEYDVALVRARLERLEKAKANHDLADMRFQVRTALTRDLGGMGNIKLYKHSRIGTKTLIEQYIDTVMETIDIVTASAGLDTRGVYEEMKLARQSFGRSALLLSGGGTLGMNHIGVVKALFDAGLLPRIISGASAGSIVCAVLCTKTDAEMPEVLVEFCRGELDVFEKDGEPHSVFGRITRFFTKGAIYDVDNLTRVMKNLLGNMTFMEAYNRTQRILNICVSSAGLYEMPRLLNYITAPHVMIWSAVAASCSVPGIFAAAQLEVKDPKTGATGQWTDDATKWIDGSVDNDLPMTRLAEIFNVNHFIVSQVNPHVVPFLDKHDELVPEAVPGLRPDHRWIHTMANLAKGEALHRMHVLAELGFFPTAMSKLRSVLGQRYAGDITIIPEMSYAQVPHILTNPTPEFMQEALSNGARATWPKLSRIRNHLAIELRLDSAVRSLLSRVAFSPSQADLRMKSASRSHRGRGRPGSKGSHHSTRSTVVMREKPGRHAVHRPIRSMLDHPSVEPSSPSKPFLKVPGPQVDYNSSADDTMSASSRVSSHEDDSDNDSDVSDLSESPPSPTPQLFSSASQPATPSLASRTFLSDSANSTRTSTPKGIGRRGGPSLTMTPSPSMPSSPEAKYKRLFHAVSPLPTIRSQNSTPEPNERHSPTISPKRSKLGLSLNLSGPREMMQRRKRSLSTGLRGFKPPNQR